jgi:hypothetical protein
LRRVEPDAVADAAVAVRVVGEDDGDPPLGRRLLAQPRPVAREVGDKGASSSPGTTFDESGVSQLTFAVPFIELARCLFRKN